MYFDICEDYELFEILEFTGCLTPCNFVEYSLTSQPAIDEKHDTRIFFALSSSTNIVSKTEIYIFPFESLVAELGGALGLFLGFSFVMVWDLIDLIIKSGLEKCKRKQTNHTLEQKQ